MNPIYFWACVALAAVAACATARAEDAKVLPWDEPTKVGGYELACTGVGDEARNDPRWPAYALRLEFANRNAEYLSDVDVTLSDELGNALFTVRCPSPWLLANVPPGKYTVTGTFKDITKTEKVKAPKSGQARFVVRFPEITGD